MPLHNWQFEEYEYKYRATYQLLTQITQFKKTLEFVLGALYFAIQNSKFKTKTKNKAQSTKHQQCLIQGSAQR